MMVQLGCDGDNLGKQGQPHCDVTWNDGNFKGTVTIPKSPHLRLPLRLVSYYCNILQFIRILGFNWCLLGLGFGKVYACGGSTVVHH